MNDPAYLLFLTVMAFLMTHELDAIQRHEWRIFPLTAPLNERLGYQVFVLVHIPLFVALVWFSKSEAFQIGLNLFVLLHVGLHWAFRRHPQYEFKNPLSIFLIVGPAPLALAHLIVLL